MRLIQQFLRFAGIGFLNTAADFAVLNLFASSLGIYTGIGIGVINAFSFSVAVLHSYFWNKKWAFSVLDSGFLKNVIHSAAAAAAGAAVLGLVVWGARQQYGTPFYALLVVLLAFTEFALWKAFRLGRLSIQAGSSREIFIFIIISLVAVLLNSGIVAGATAFFPPQFGANQELWTNIIKAAATAISLIWNFVGYKLFVFKR